MNEKRFERIYADVDVFCRDHNAKGISQLIEREDYDKIVDLLNEQHEQIERLKQNFRVLDEVKCELADENEQLQNQIDELEDDNEKYSKSLDKLENYTKRFIPTKCLNEFKDCKTNRYYWLDHEGNLEGALELLNLMDCENEQLKQQNKGIQDKVWKLLELLEKEKGIDKRKIIDWWNGDV